MKKKKPTKLLLRKIYSCGKIQTGSFERDVCQEKNKQTSIILFNGEISHVPRIQRTRSRNTQYAREIRDANRPTRFELKQVQQDNDASSRYLFHWNIYMYLEFDSFPDDFGRFWWFFQNANGHTDKWTDGPTDGQTLIQRCEDASKKMKSKKNRGEEEE